MNNQGIIQAADWIELPQWVADYNQRRSIYKISPGIDPEKINPIDCYVYALIDPRDGAIFYIGKGTRRRAWHHLKLARNDRNHKKQQRIKAIYQAHKKPVVWILIGNLTADVAYRWEAAYIYQIKGLANKNIPTEKAQAIPPGPREICYGTPVKTDHTYTIAEFITEITRIVKKGRCISREGHLYLFENQMHNLSDTIQYLPDRFRKNKKPTHEKGTPDFFR